MNKLFVHIPHSSMAIPLHYRSLFLVPPHEIKLELMRMTDTYTDELADWPDRLVFPVSRLLCDVERFRNKQMESMAKAGMWVCYTHGSEGTLIKLFGDAHEKEMLDLYYDPHHIRLAAMAMARIELFGHCLIVDVHSFSSSPLPYEPCQDISRPDICIGTDNYHTPDSLKEFTANFFTGCGYSVAFNNPYSGAITPLDMAGRESRLFSIMIEMNRRLYLDPSTGLKNGSYQRLKDCLTAYLSAVEKQL
jgi:N-formylglutamate deformylase